MHTAERESRRRYGIGVGSLEPAQQAPVAQQVQDLPADTERLRRIPDHRLTLHHQRPHPGEAQLDGQHQTGRAGTDDHHIGLQHAHTRDSISAGGGFETRILRHHPGLAASPRVRYRLKVQRVMALVGLAVLTLSACASAPATLADPAIPAQTQDSAEWAIVDGYVAKQIECTPDLPPTFDYLTWDEPGFTPEGGAGMITDANPQLGGRFVATWATDYWAVEYMYC
jgi:hypothetical protein